MNWLVRGQMHPQARRSRSEAYPVVHGNGGLPGEIVEIVGRWPLPLR